MTQDPLAELATKVKALLDERSAIGPEKFVAWLYSYAMRGQEILAPKQQPGLESDIRKEYNRFGTGVSGQRVVEWAHKHNIILPQGQHWWFIRERQAEYTKGEAKNSDLLQNPPRTGCIQGIPNSEGIPRITNGIDVYIERPDGTLLLGHRDNLKWDHKPKDLTKLKSAKDTSDLTPDPLDEILLEAMMRTL